MLNKCIHYYCFRFVVVIGILWNETSGSASAKGLVRDKCCRSEIINAIYDSIVKLSFFCYFNADTLVLGRSKHGNIKIGCIFCVFFLFVDLYPTVGLTGGDKIASTPSS
jgi:hypothetical protein